MSYEDTRNPALQWGYWLHADGAYGKPLVDDDGRRWSSIREAFWVGRLGFSEEHAGRYMESELERLLAVLGAKARRVVHVAEEGYDLFDGEKRFTRFHDLWMVAQGLLSQPGGGLTFEAHAVLLMLAGTRPSQVRGVPVGSDAVATMLPRDASEPEISAWLDRVDAFAAGLPFRFERREFARKAAVAFVGDELGGVAPIRRTIWQQSFADHASRDRFHIWLAIRIDRWEEWGNMAHTKGAPHLTQYFLAMAAETVDIAGRDEFRPRALL